MNAVILIAVFLIGCITVRGVLSDAQIENSRTDSVSYSVKNFRYPDPQEDSLTLYSNIRWDNDPRYDNSGCSDDSPCDYPHSNSDSDCSNDSHYHQGEMYVYSNEYKGPKDKGYNRGMRGSRNSWRGIR